MKKFNGDISNIQKKLNEQLTQKLIPERFIPIKPEELKDKDVVYIFDGSDTFNITFDELVEIVGKARMTSNMIPVLGTIGD